MLLKGLTLLVVEDDVDNLELVSAHLEADGAVVISAGSISAALEMTQGVELHAVLCDLELPDGNGCDLLRKVREREQHDDVPAIALTGYSDARWRERARGCGFDRYMVKPFSLAQLTDWVRELIDRKSGLIEATCPAEAAVRGESARRLR